MPELPDLLYISSYLRSHLTGRTIRALEIREPVILRVTVPRPAAEVLSGRSIGQIDVHGPFLRFGLSGGVDIVVNLMLAGKLQHQPPSGRAQPFVCLAFLLDDETLLNFCDERKMAKVYIVPSDATGTIPRYAGQGIPILSSAFTPDRLRDLAARHGRKQVRVFLNDQSILSAVGNAYADEILFEAGIHPKTFVARLSGPDVERLHGAIGTVMRRGMEEVERAAEPIHVKVRGHMRVRNRHGSPCPRCGTTIRREGVRGHDVFYCPRCQPSSRRLFLDWRNIPGGGTGEKSQDDL